MIEALLKGKLSRANISEDLLTSLVLGTLKYLDVRFLARFLSFARTLEGGWPFDGLALRSAHYRFWPSVKIKGQVCEPDVLIKLVVGKAREVHPLMWAVAAAFLLFFAVGPIEAALGMH